MAQNHTERVRSPHPNNGRMRGTAAIVPRAMGVLVAVGLLLFGNAGLAEGWTRMQRPPGPAIPVPGAPPAPDRRPITIDGWIVASGRSVDRLEVRIETAGGTLNDFTFSETSGHFEFRDVSLDPSESYYIVVEAEGFAPHRERLDYHVTPRRGGRLTISLGMDRATGESTPGNASPVVDVSQLAAVIPDEARDEFGRALDDIEKGDHERAITRLERAVEVAPDFFDALNTLGATYLEMERYRDAEAVLDRARELGPAAASPLLHLGTLRYREGEADYQSGRIPESVEKFAAAVDLLEEAIRRDPLASRAHHNLGAALYRLQRYDAAEASLYRALELSPELLDARLVLVNVYTRQYRYDDALDQVDAYLDQNPDGPRREALERLREQIQSVRQ